jgi:hypothetical protein
MAIVAWRSLTSATASPIPLANRLQTQRVHSRNEVVSLPVTLQAGQIRRGVRRAMVDIASVRCERPKRCAVLE